MGTLWAYCLKFNEQPKKWRALLGCNRPENQNQRAPGNKCQGNPDGHGQEVRHPLLFPVGTITISRFQ
jgi:hypothetical protein